MTVRADPQTVAVLNRLDWQLGEAGRRDHHFSWLRDARSGDWLCVHAYYPSNRVVVVASEDPDLLEQCEQDVPANGLYLLTLESEHLGPDGSSEAQAQALRDRLAAQGWVGRTASTPRAGPGVRASALELAPRLASVAPRETWAARQGGSIRRRGDPSAGVLLVLVAVAELVIGGGLIGLAAGDYVLGFGLVLDACARVLGAVSASANDESDAVWLSVLIGSPALWASSERTGDAAALAQVTAILAGVTVALGLVLLIL